LRHPPARQLLGSGGSSAAEALEASRGSQRVSLGLRRARAETLQTLDLKGGRQVNRQVQQGRGGGLQMADNLSAGVRVRLHSL
ncbi:MAG: hypothetical protein ACPIOQ_05700, partial [Promethearchaeia archaeon]